MSHVIEVNGLVKRFGDTTAVAGIELAARPGSVLALLGPNGAGKTTVVRILSTLLRPDAGVALVDGLDVVRQAGRVRRLIGLTGQDTSVDEDLTGAENLVLIGRLLGLRAAPARARARELLAEFELGEAAARRVATYSGGMRRRLDVAASLVGHPRVVFLDEPTTGLDPGKRDQVWRMIRAMAGDGVTVLLTTQYLQEADALADEVAVMDHGKVIAHGAPRDLKRVFGGQTIAVQPEDPARIDDAAAIIHAVAGRAPEPVDRGVLAVPVDGDGAFTEVVRRLAAARIGVVELSLRLPSLDDVFFALTGQHNVDAEAGDEREDVA